VERTGWVAAASVVVAEVDSIVERTGWVVPVVARSHHSHLTSRGVAAPVVVAKVAADSTAVQA